VKTNTLTIKDLGKELSDPQSIRTREFGINGILAE
jgi:hypothetical protein